MATIMENDEDGANMADARKDDPEGERIMTRRPINIQPVTEEMELFTWGWRDSSRQPPARLLLSLSDGRVWCQTCDWYMLEKYSPVLSWPIAALRRDAANQLMTDLADHLRIVLNGSVLQFGSDGSGVLEYQPTSILCGRLATMAAERAYLWIKQCCRDMGDDEALLIDDDDATEWHRNNDATS